MSAPPPDLWDWQVVAAVLVAVLLCVAVWELVEA
jgi:hypothetical protein